MQKNFLKVICKSYVLLNSHIIKGGFFRFWELDIQILSGGTHSNIDLKFIKHALIFFFLYIPPTIMYAVFLKHDFMIRLNRASSFINQSESWKAQSFNLQ